MKALEITEPGVCRLVELTVPTPGPGEVLLCVRSVGFCGSDLNTFRGLNPLVFPYTECGKCSSCLPSGPAQLLPL